VKVQLEAVMTKDVEVVAPETPLADLVAIMKDQRISCVIVCEDRVPVGVVSERDLVTVLADELAQPGTGGSTAVAAEVMSRPLVTVENRWSVERAMELIQENGIRRLPVVDGSGELAGVVTQTDLLAAQRHGLEREVAARTSEIQAAGERLRELSLSDELLGIGSRRAMNQVLERIHAITERYRRVYSLVLLDLDYFKDFNDFYGQPDGDEVLRQTAHTLLEVGRNADSVYRYGGEELLVLLPETPLDGAQVLAERAREAIFDLRIRNEPSPLGWISVSAGVAASHCPGEAAPLSWRDPLSRADAALRAAKRAGRNRVAIAEAAEPEAPDSDA